MNLTRAFIQNYAIHENIQTQKWSHILRNTMEIPLSSKLMKWKSLIQKIFRQRFW